MPWFDAPLPLHWLTLCRWIMFENPRLITHDDPSKKHRIRLAIVQKLFCNEDSVFLLFRCQDFLNQLQAHLLHIQILPYNFKHTRTRNIGTVSHISDHFSTVFLDFSFYFFNVAYVARSGLSSSSSIIAHWFFSTSETTHPLLHCCLQHVSTIQIR